MGAIIIAFPGAYGSYANQFPNTNGTANVVFFGMLLLVFVPWVWLCWHALKTLNALRTELLMSFVVYSFSKCSARESLHQTQVFNVLLAILFLVMARPIASDGAEINALSG
jgi:hypothetical protein